MTRAGICVPPTVSASDSFSRFLALHKFVCMCVCMYVTYLPYRVSGSTLTAVGRSQLLARWPGTHCRILSGIQRAAQTVLGVYLKRACWRVTSASSVLAVLNDYALYKSTHSLTHSLVHMAIGPTRNDKNTINVNHTIFSTDKDSSTIT